MAYFWSPRDKRKYEIVKVEDWSFIERLFYNKPNNKYYRIFYKDGYGNIDYTQITTDTKYLSDGSIHPVWKGMCKFFEEQKLKKKNK